MTTFIFASALLLILVLFRLWWVLFRRTPVDRQVMLDTNKSLYQERAKEIERQFAAGEISGEEKSALDAENARRLIAEADPGAASGGVSNKANMALVLGLAVVLPLIAALMC